VRQFSVERGAAAIICVWSFVVFLHCLAEVNRFSAWHALGSLALVTVAFTLVALPMGLAVSGL
jgi:hypothetical protein